MQSILQTPTTTIWPAFHLQYREQLCFSLKVTVRYYSRAFLWLGASTLDTAHMLSTSDPYLTWGHRKPYPRAPFQTEIEQGPVESAVAKENSLDVLSEPDGILKLKGLHHSGCYLAQLPSVFCFVFIFKGPLRSIRCEIWIQETLHLRCG